MKKTLLELIILITQQKALIDNIKNHHLNLISNYNLFLIN